MSKVLILGGLSTDEDRSEYGQSLSKFIDGHEFDVANFDELTFSIGPSKFSIIVSKLGKELLSYDLVMFRGAVRGHRDLAYIISRYMSLHNKQFFNDYSVYRSPTKLAQAAYFFEQKVPFVNTYFALNSVDYRQLIDDNLNYPFILKDNVGSHGQNNFLIKSPEELEEKLKNNSTIQFIAQDFHPNECDYRVLVMGDIKPLIIKRKAANGSHLNNTSQGGAADLVEDLPGELLAQSIRLAKNAGMMLAGVDILPNLETGTHYFLEMNSQPQILTGAFVTEKLNKLALLLGSLSDKG